jgi:hypothetical protein
MDGPDAPAQPTSDDPDATEVFDGDGLSLVLVGHDRWFLYASTSDDPALWRLDLFESFSAIMCEPELPGSARDHTQRCGRIYRLLDGLSGEEITALGWWRIPGSGMVPRDRFESFRRARNSALVD